MCNILERHGWHLARTKSSQHIYKKPGETAIITVPVHGNKDLRPGQARHHHETGWFDG
jgi:predicted RNA binding protein YcfA (HicA-like mRNA interferase family)